MKMEETKDEVGGLNQNYIQITPKRNVADNLFASGTIDFDYNIGGKFAWRPSKSYFRIELSLTRTGGSQPFISSGFAFADNVCANLFDNVYVRGGGADISSIVNYAAQASQVKMRLSKTRAWMNSIGKSAFGISADFDNRMNMISRDGVTGEEDTVANIRSYGLGGFGSSAEVLTGATTTVIGTNTSWDDTDSPYSVNSGDQIYINGITKTVTVIIDNTTLIIHTDTDTTTSTTKVSFSTIRPQTSLQSNKGYYHYVPPCGIFDYEGLLGSGDYRIQLNPNPNFESAIVESFGGMTPNYNYLVSVKSIQFYACIEKVDIPVTGIERLFLNEQHIQSKRITSNNATYDFTVPPSTQSIAVWVQSGDAGRNTQVPPTKFKTADGTDMKLTGIQLTYANTTKPSTDWDSEYKSSFTNNNNNNMTQRYLDTQKASGMFYSEGGGETFLEWSKRGPLYLFNFDRDSSDRSTNLQLNMAFTNIEADAQVLVCANYSKIAQITSKNGYITDVTSLSI